MPQLRIEKYQKIWVPDLISGDEQKALAFCGGWLAGLGLLPLGERQDLSQRLGITIPMNPDPMKEGPLENVFWWGYFAAKSTFQTESSVHPLAKEGRTEDLVTIHERMERDSRFIPHFAWGHDSDEGDEE